MEETRVMQCKWCGVERDAPAKGPHVCDPVNVRQVAIRDNNAAWERRASNLLDIVESPASREEGAPGSLHRRAWELGQRRQELVRELRHCRAIVDEAQRVANCFNGDVLTKSGTEFVAVLDNLRAALAAYVDPE